MSKTFRDWDVEQCWLLPPSVLDFVPPDHLAHFIRDTVRESLDLSSIMDSYTEERGYPPYHPTMMTALLLYAYCQAVYSSRRIAKGCTERLDFMAVTGLNQPDFRTVSDFRKRHLGALSGLFVQVLKLCRQAGLAKLGHVALDGTKVKANASKHKSMSYKRLGEKEAQLKREVTEWFKRADAIDESEDREERNAAPAVMPEWIANKQARIQRIREAKAALEAEAKSQGEAQPKPKEQYNFTDPESAIMKGPDSFVQAYNAQAVVDADSQVIVAQALSDRPTDVTLLGQMVGQIKVNTGRQAQEFSADARVLLGRQSGCTGTAQGPGLYRHRKTTPWPNQNRGPWQTGTHSGNAPALGARRVPQPLPTAQANGRTGVRSDQASAWLPTISITWVGQDEWRMESDLHGSQPFEARRATLPREPRTMIPLGHRISNIK